MEPCKTAKKSWARQPWLLLWHSRRTSGWPQSTSSTNKIILDYLLYLSIQSRIRQCGLNTGLSSDTAREESEDVSCEACHEHQGRSFPGSEATPPKWPHEKNVMEYLLSGVLTNYTDKRRLSTDHMDAALDRRLHLCKLTHRIFDRYEATESHARHHDTHTNRWKTTGGTSWEEKQGPSFFVQPARLALCKRHHRQGCVACGPVTPSFSLSDSIPLFLKASADMLRKVLESENNTESAMRFAGQPVMGGGMPPRWYDLFLDLLTQAAIEAYVYDDQTGPKAIVEIFSYGKVTDEDEEDEEDVEDEEAEEDEGSLHSWELRPEDHHLLFPKTRTMFLFKTQLLERENELLHVKKEKGLSQHLEQLAQKYPSKPFEKSIIEFIEMVHRDMDPPALMRHDHTLADASVPFKLSHVSPYPCEGPLLMPEIPDENDDGVATGTKRSLAALDSTMPARKRRVESMPNTPSSLFS